MKTEVIKTVHKKCIRMAAKELMATRPTAFTRQFDWRALASRIEAVGERVAITEAIEQIAFGRTAARYAASKLDDVIRAAELMMDEAKRPIHNCTVSDRSRWLPGVAPVVQ
ncbi:hypothetical protein HGB24_03485 [Candidatus Saccharibacteria bacterium]|nr:hypothetical protein [Candidatus Saccharibacteria bacterium]